MSTFLSNNFIVGIARNPEAIIPSIVLATKNSHKIEINKKRTPIEETGTGATKYGGQFVEKEGMGSETLEFYLRPSAFAFFIAMITGKDLTDSPTATGGTPEQKRYEMNKSLTIPNYTIIPEFALFAKGDGINKYKAIAKKITITGAQGEMIIVSVEIDYHSKVSSGVSLPETFPEDGVENMFSSCDLGLSSSGATKPRTNDIDDYSIEIDTGIGNLQAKGGNSFRAEGGSITAICSFGSTQTGTELRELWEQSLLNSPVGFNFNITNTMNYSLTLAFSNMQLSQRDKDRELYEVAKESSTFVSAPFSLDVGIVVPTDINLITS